jgi:hypothetical protein
MKKIGLVAGLLAAALSISDAYAVIIYDFSGECAIASDCTGTATGILTLADTYTPGTTITGADFISFSYASSQGSFVVPRDLAFLDIFGALPENQGPAVEWMSVDFAENNTGLNACAETGLIERGNASIDCVTDGWWYAEFSPVGIGDDGGDFDDRDHGASHAWTLRKVPEPTTLALMALGLVSLGFRRKHI